MVTFGAQAPSKSIKQKQAIQLHKYLERQGAGRSAVYNQAFNLAGVF